MEGSGDENEVTQQEVEKYIKVRQAMQEQGLSLTAFSSLEDRIERDDALRRQVLDAPKLQAPPSPPQK